jgi:hypothetical protein
MMLAVCRSSSLHSEFNDIESRHPTSPRPIVEVESRDEEDKLLELGVLPIDFVDEMAFGDLPSLV